MSDTRKDAPPVCAGPRLDVRKPALALPPRAADCNAHVFGPVAQYPYAANRLIGPERVLERMQGG